MLNTFRYTLLTLIRSRSILIWALAFPLILGTLFNAAFGNLDTADQFKAIPVAVVEDANYHNEPAFEQLIKHLSEDGNNQMLQVYPASTNEAAQSLLNDKSVLGIYTIDNNAEPSLSVANFAELGDVTTVNQTILKTILDNYVRSRATLETIVAKNPQALADPTLIEKLFSPPTFTEEITVTANTASETVRLFYALLGFAAIMAANVAVIAIARTQANLSSVGARRAVGATGRTQTLISTLLASWLLSFVCLLVAFVYLRYFLSVNFGDRDLMCMLALAIASLMATALGSFIGALPKLSAPVKGGMLAGISCFLALFCGLYGTASQRLADTATKTLPWLQTINPAKQVTDLFYSLYFYDTYDSFFFTLVTLLGITLVFFLLATLLMRRQRYASL